MNENKRDCEHGKLARSCTECEAATVLEQAQARIAELEWDVEVWKATSRENKLIAEQMAEPYKREITALALQVEQMLGNIKATEKCLTQDPCKENAANNALAFIRANYALSTAPASEIIAAHDAKVIERCAGVADDCAYGCGAAIAIRALIAAPKPGESKEVG